jgi:hypothetical protein
MTSSRRLAANRRNARLSTGPRGVSGKQSAAMNALRHGLSLPVLADPNLAKEVVELAERISKGSTDPQVQERARNIAAAQIDIERVRHVRYTLIARPVPGPSLTGAGYDEMQKRIKQMWALDRYERRAMSRRKSAVRALEIAVCCRSVRGEQAMIDAIEG